MNIEDLPFDPIPGGELRYLKKDATEDEQRAYWKAVLNDPAEPIHRQAIAKMELEHLNRPARHRFNGMKKV